jgi:hypothetical protein
MGNGVEQRQEYGHKHKITITIKIIKKRDGQQIMDKIIKTKWTK